MNAKLFKSLIGLLKSQGDIASVQISDDEGCVFRVGITHSEHIPVSELERRIDEHFIGTPQEVVILKSRHQELCDAEATLIALQNQGVDSWDGYSEAMRELEPEEDDAVFDDDVI